MLLLLLQPCMVQVVERFVLEVELLLPLVRVALTCLTVDSLQLLQAQAVGETQQPWLYMSCRLWGCHILASHAHACQQGLQATGQGISMCSLWRPWCVACCCLLMCAALMVSVFRAYPQQRSSLFDEVLTSVVDNIHVTGKAPPRYFEAMGAGLEPLPVMMATSLVVQLVQVSASILHDTLLAFTVSQTECVVLLKVHVQELVVVACARHAVCRRLWSCRGWMLTLRPYRQFSGQPLGGLTTCGRQCLADCQQPRQPGRRVQPTSS